MQAWAGLLELPLHTCTGTRAFSSWRPTSTSLASEPAIPSWPPSEPPPVTSCLTAKARGLSELLSQEAKLVLLSMYRLVAVAVHFTDHQDSNMLPVIVRGRHSSAEVDANTSAGLKGCQHIGCMLCCLFFSKCQVHTGQGKFASHVPSVRLCGGVYAVSGLLHIFQQAMAVPCSVCLV